MHERALYNSQVLKIYWSPNRCWRSGKFRLEWDSLSLSLVLVECRVLRAVIIIRNAKQRLNARVYFVEASILTSERFDANTKFVYWICLLFIVCSRMQKAICDPQSFAKSCAWMLLSILMLYIYSAKNVTYNFNYCERFSQLCWLRCPVLRVYANRHRIIFLFNAHKTYTYIYEPKRRLCTSKRPIEWIPCGEEGAYSCVNSISNSTAKWKWNISHSFLPPSPPQRKNARRFVHFAGREEIFVMQNHESHYLNVFRYSLFFLRLLVLPVLLLPAKRPRRTSVDYI